ncbi:MAG: Gfo/Idh/MocA family oxidoreductase [candidate division Zixibacteria bacterium]|nr:Gfo/Idh/MocA family oxidoreductase [candidate division Zixibacteria bacterium]
MQTIPPNQPIRIAFVGCGNATRMHSKTLKGFGAQIQRYYASRSAEKAADWNARFKGSGSFGSYQEAIHSPDVDVIFLATPPSSHLDLALQSLQAGKHVIVEKPPFLHAADIDQIEDAQQQSEHQVFVAENYFYKSILIKLREIIQKGLIGEVLFVHINALKTQKTGNWRDDSETAGGGAIFEGGIHWINFITNLGLTVDSVNGFSPFQKTRDEKSMMVAIQYKEGAVGTLSYSWEVPSPLKGLRISRIFGREGSITFESNGVFLYLHGKKKRFYPPQLSDIAGYKGMFKDFFQSLRSGSEPQFTLNLARHDLHIIEQIYATAKTTNTGGNE